MSEPGLQLQPLQESLWEKAPAWRNLTIAASFLTLAAVALPVLLPQPEVMISAPQTAFIKPAAPAPSISAPAAPAAAPVPAEPAHVAALPDSQTPAQACGLRQPAGPYPMGLGTIIGFETPAQSLADIPRREARLGGTIDPAYVHDLRAMVRQDDGRVQGFDVLPGMTVNMGDRVTLQDSYRNQSRPCSYIPILITADSGPTASPAQTPQ